MARSSECTEQYAQKVFDRDPHCQRRLFSTTTGVQHHYPDRQRQNGTLGDCGAGTPCVGAKLLALIEGGNRDDPPSPINIQDML